MGGLYKVSSVVRKENTSEQERGGEGEAMGRMSLLCPNIHPTETTSPRVSRATEHHGYAESQRGRTHAQPEVCSDTCLEYLVLVVDEFDENGLVCRAVV